MKALIKQPGLAPKMTEVLVPAENVIIKVLTVGICRTDSRVVDGTIPVEKPTVLGHEFCGIAQNGKYAGQRVAVDPLINGLFMGVDIDGALSEFTAVPEENVFPVGNNLADEEAAYLEPIAASMAVTKSSATKEMVGGIFGVGRIAELTKLILQTEGYNIEYLQPGIQYDYVIETGPADLTPAVEALRPKGLLIIKSRGRTATIPLGTMVAKELRAEAVAYAPYPEAVKWLEANASLLRPFIGETFPFNSAMLAFETAKTTESVKTFIRVGQRDT